MSSDFASTVKRTARTSHKCGECFRTISPRERYMRTAGSWEGDFYVIKACEPCARLRTLLCTVDPDFWESCFGGVHAWVENDLWQELSESFSWLVTLHVRRLCMLFEKRWQGLADELKAAEYRVALEDPRGRRLVARIHERKRLAESSREDQHQAQREHRP